MNLNLIIVDHFEQGSQEWRQARCGRITMSNAAKLLTGGKGVTRQSYLVEVASEIASGILAEKFSTWDMVRGNLLEPFAIATYTALTGLAVRRVGLGYLHADKRISASPDGLVMDGGRIARGVEVKCQSPKNHMRTIIEMQHPEKFAPQMQGGMWIFGADEWDYISYCPEFQEMPIVILNIKRDEVMINKIADACELALTEVDQYARIVGSGYGRNVLAEKIRLSAVELLDIMQDKPVEFN